MSAEAQSHLPQWFDEASSAALALPRTVFADNDMAHGKLLFGVEKTNTRSRGLERTRTNTDNRRIHVHELRLFRRGCQYQCASVKPHAYASLLLVGKSHPRSLQ
jgi:hypothetical protein